MEMYTTLGGFIETNFVSQNPIKITMDLADDGVSYKMKIYSKAVHNDEEKEIIVETLARLPKSIELIYDITKPVEERAYFNVIIPEDVKE